MGLHKADGRWLGRLMQLARVARTWSKDPDEQVGCALASPDFRQQSLGYNGLIAGMDDSLLETMSREAKRTYTLHAEANAIHNCRADTRGWSLAVTKAPCLECAATIHNAGIARVVFSGWPYERSRWYESQMDAMRHLRVSGVEVWVEDLGTASMPASAVRQP